MSFVLETDRPALRDLANFVVPRASHKWYFIGLQLFDPNDVEVLTNMRAHKSRNSDENCIDVFNYWLDTDVNANWQKIIDALKCPSVYLPNVAKQIENMLSDVSHHYMYAIYSITMFLNNHSYHMHIP